MRVPGVQAAAEVGDRDDRELQALRRVNGHHPDAVVALGLHRRHALALVAAGALGRQGEEAGEVAALVALVLAREPHQLADVRHSPRAAVAGDQPEVVAERRHGPLDQRLEGQEGRLRAQHRQRLAEAPQCGVVVRSDLVEPRLLVLGWLGAVAEAPVEHRPDVTRAIALVACRAAQQPERVGARGDREAAERAEQALVVERVRDHAEQPDQILDLLLGPVAAPAHHERLQPRPPQRLLVRVDVREGAQQDGDVAAPRAPESTSRRRRSARKRASATIRVPEPPGGGSRRRRCRPRPSCARSLRAPRRGSEAARSRHGPRMTGGPP